MGRSKTSELPHYELLYLISNKYSEEEIKPIKAKVEELITKNEGSITLNEDWGKKRLAYAIQHFKHGYYQLLEFDLPGKNLIKISTALRLSNDILRHQIVTKRLRTEEEIKEDKIIAEKIAKKQEDKQKEEKLEEKLEEEKKKEKKKEENKTEKKEDIGKMKLEDINLDEKLDKILETDNLL